MTVAYKERLMYEAFRRTDSAAFGSADEWSAAFRAEDRAYDEWEAARRIDRELTALSLAGPEWSAAPLPCYAVEPAP